MLPSIFLYKIHKIENNTNSSNLFGNESSLTYKSVVWRH